MIPYQIPAVTPEGEPFWQGCKEQKLFIPYCLDCNKYHFYPRSICPHCWSNNLDNIQASGKGKVYSFTVTYPKESEPYIVALIELEEGVRILSNILDCSPKSLQIGMQVRATFKEITESGFFIPQFLKQ